MDCARPAQGSCLIYGDSGLPNQIGPLAPDKIVMRDGWSNADVYLLLNLRFTGWHRHKGTGTINLLYQNNPLVTDELKSRSFAWLPLGRSLIRDKRVPRENLNGLLIEQSGMRAILRALTGIGSAWAQDPPYYARLLKFEPNQGPQIAQTAIENWHGWSHVRTVYFYPQGPIVVVDSVAGGIGRAALTWHVVGDGERDRDTIWLRRDTHPARIVFSSGAWQNIKVNAENTSDRIASSIVYSAPDDGGLELVTVFLSGKWVNAQTDISYQFDEPLNSSHPSQIAVRIVSNQRTLELLHRATRLK